jgi:hypothetical protein
MYVYFIRKLTERERERESAKIGTSLVFQTVVHFGFILS